MVNRCLLSVLVYFSTPVFAITEKEAPSYFSSMLPLFIIVLLIILLAWGTKKLQLPAFSGQKDISIIRQLPLGTKERVLVIKVANEQFLVGATPQSINLIAKLDSPLEEVSKSNQSLISPFAKKLTDELKDEDDKKV